MRPSRRFVPALAALLLAAAPAAADDVFLDFKTFGTVTDAAISVADLTLTADDPAGDPTLVHMLNLNGLGVVGGSSNTTTDHFESLHVTFDELTHSVRFNVGVANNQDADAFIGEATVEAFSGGTSLGVVAIDDVGWKEVSAFFGGAPVSAFTVRADVDGNRIDVIAYGTYVDDLGGALAGTHGAPQLELGGYTLAGETITLSTDGLLEDSVATMVVGFSALGAPFKGGVLVPNPDLLLAGLPTGPLGQLQVDAVWPAGVPSGGEIHVQTWVADAAGPAGFAASNAIRITTP